MDDTERPTTKPAQGVGPQALLEDPAYANRFLDLHQNADLLNQKAVKPPLIRNLVITQLTPELLHDKWPYLRRGALDILRKVGEHTNWTPEDLYAALRYPEASHTILWMVTRNGKDVGWSCGNIERDRYGKLEFFVWDGWTIPPRERDPEDDVDGAREQLFDYIKLWAKNNGCWRLTCLSSRALEHIGWTKGHTTYYMLV